VKTRNFVVEFMGIVFALTVACGLARFY